MGGRGGGRASGRPGVDAKESGPWRSAPVAAASAAKKPLAAPVRAGQAEPRAGAKPARLDPCAVIEEDLRSFAEIHTLLRALNDAYAGGSRVGDLVAKVPVLGARCVRRAQKRFPAKSSCTLAEALTLIGNLGLETELLQLLEDLTILSADLKAAAERPKGAP
jgi:hypothetical protein